MSFWIPPIWFGRQAGDAIGRIPILNEELGVPVHTRVIERLQEELPTIDIWPDVDRTEGAEDSIVVMNISGDWTVSTSSWQRRSRTIRVVASSATSNGAEVLMDKVAKILRGSRDVLRLITANDITGGYDDESETYFRGAEFTFKGRL